MKRLAYAKRRDANEKEIVRALESIGCTVIRLDPFDLLVGYRGNDFKIEVKTKNAKKKPSQIEIEKNWKGTPLYFVRTIEQALDVVNREI